MGFVQFRAFLYGVQDGGRQQAGYVACAYQHLEILRLEPCDGSRVAADFVFHVQESARVSVDADYVLHSVHPFHHRVVYAV